MRNVIGILLSGGKVLKLQDIQDNVAKAFVGVDFTDQSTQQMFAEEIQRITDGGQTNEGLAFRLKSDYYGEFANEVLTAL